MFSRAENESHGEHGDTEKGLWEEGFVVEGGGGRFSRTEKESHGEHGDTEKGFLEEGLFGRRVWWNEGSHGE